MLRGNAIFFNVTLDKTFETPSNSRMKSSQVLTNCTRLFFEISAKKIIAKKYAQNENLAYRSSYVKRICLNVEFPFPLKYQINLLENKI